ncbi:hypothetical protein LUZ60_006774 [Juncus effusus]|nr:hypothetical protein LUZ60_006774 [Juncus effusus]
MEWLQVRRCSSVEWKPAAVLAMAASWDGSQVAVARDGGAVEIWLVSPGSVGWHCQLTIHGDSNCKVSSLVWSRPRSKSEKVGRLLSSSIDGSVSEWDIFSLKQKKLIDSLGVSIWQMALEPSYQTDSIPNGKASTDLDANTNDSDSSSLDSDSDSDSDADSIQTKSTYVGSDYQRLAMACDDGSVRLYNIPDSDALNYIRSFPKVTGRVLSVTWSHDAKFIYSGSSDGLIRCWDVKSFHEIYRITAGQGGINSSTELCIWSLISLRCGTVVSGDSTGGVQFWDGRNGTLLQAYAHHQADVNALEAAPNHTRVFSAGSDGQVILYKKTNEKEGNDMWSYVGYVRTHTHDIRALTMAVPINKEALHEEEKAVKIRRREKPVEYSYHKWAHLGIPMLISSGDDTKLFAYSAMEFTDFAPHDICPAPQRPLVHLSSNNNNINNNNYKQIMIVQSSNWLDILTVNNNSGGKGAPAQHVMRLQSKELRRILCSGISPCGSHVGYSDGFRPCLFNLRINANNNVNNKGKSLLEKVNLPKGLPNACCMVFSADSNYLILAGHNSKIYVVDVKKSTIISTFVPQRKMVVSSNCVNQEHESVNQEHESSNCVNQEPPVTKMPQRNLDESSNYVIQEPPVTKMFTSFDGQWLAAVNSFGDIYVFNLETQRQHWFVSRMNDASVTAGGFSPHIPNALVITTSANEVYVFDVEAKQQGEWSRMHTHRLPKRFLEFPGEVVGLTFPPSKGGNSSVIVYSSRAMCFIDFGMPVNQEDEDELDSDKITKLKRKRKNQIKIDESKQQNKKKNFDFLPFKDPVWFVGHLNDGSLFIVEKKWMSVVKTFDAPVHRHTYGT